MLRSGAGRALALVLLGLAGCQTATPPPDLPLDQIDLPPGYQIDLYAVVPDVHSIDLSADGRTLYTGTRRGMAGALQDQDGDGVADQAVRLVGGLDGPVSVASAPDGGVYLLDRQRILRLRDGQPLDLIVPPGVLPEAGERKAAFGPDGQLYVAAPADCRECTSRAFQGTIVRLAPDGHNLHIFARGVRHPGALDWHPQSGELFFTDQGNGPSAPDELNRAPAPGLHFGHVVLSDAAGSAGLPEAALPSPTFPPVLELAPGITALDFYEGPMFAARLQGDALLAVSGEGREGAGPAVLRVDFDELGNPQRAEVFLAWRAGKSEPPWGRPVDLEELPDGSLLIADSQAGVIYRLAYGQLR